VPVEPHHAYHVGGLRGHLSTSARVSACVDASRRGAEFLRRAQLPTGEFRTLLSADPRLLADPVPDSSPFATTFVLQALGELTPAVRQGLEETIAKALDFLAEEQDPEGLWRYWTRSSPRRSLVPPDLDDTSCASWVLARYGRGFKDSRALVAANRDAQGRFLTWVGPAEGDNDVDGVVNANVVLYLGIGPETAAACEYLSGLIESPESELGSWYYPDPLALDYALSRAACHGVAPLRSCRERLLTRVSDRCGAGAGHQDPLSAALAAATLMNCEAEVDLLDSQIEIILASQCQDGSWPRLAFYSGPRPPLPRSVWFGSEELTTALCLEAAARYAGFG
jgi:hypothetical protein